MDTYTAGTQVTLAARFESVGVATDPEMPLRLTITPVAGGAAVVDTTELGHPATGIFTYAWTPDAVLLATDYLVTWDPAGDDLAATEIVRVLPATVGTWATVAQCLGFTGETLTAQDLQVPSALIGLYAGVQVDQPANSIKARDRHWLAMATSFQAVWMKPKMDTILRDRESHVSTSADGVQVQRTTDADLTLAPLAARALRNLSWIGNRTTLALPEGYTLKGMVNPIREDHDHITSWMSRPIG